MILTPIKKKLNTIETLNRKNKIDTSLAMIEHSQAKKRLDIALQNLNHNLSSLSKCERRIADLSSSDSFAVADYLEVNQYFDLLTSKKQEHQIKVRELTLKFEEQQQLLKKIKIKNNALEDINAKAKLELEHKKSQKNDLESTEIWCSVRRFK